jgi:hypothetical protein
MEKSKGVMSGDLAGQVPMLSTRPGKNSSRNPILCIQAQNIAIPHLLQKYASIMEVFSCIVDFLIVC